MKYLIMLLGLTLCVKGFGLPHVPHFYHVQVKPFTSTLRLYEHEGRHVITFAVDHARPFFSAHINLGIGGLGDSKITLYIKNERNRVVQVPEIQNHILDLMKNRMKVFLNSFSLLNPIEYEEFIMDLNKVDLSERELYDFLLK